MSQDGARPMATSRPSSTYSRSGSWPLEWPSLSEEGRMMMRFCTASAATATEPLTGAAETPQRGRGMKEGASSPGQDWPRDTAGAAVVARNGAGCGAGRLAASAVSSASPQNWQNWLLSRFSRLQWEQTIMGASLILYILEARRPL